MKQIHIATFGCQMNDRDSQTIAHLMAAEDYQLTGQMEQADLILVNTCSIRQKAEEKTYSLLGRLKRLKRKKPGLIIGVGGCVAQQEGERLLERIPHLDLVFGTGMLYRLPELVEQVRRDRSRVSHIERDPRFSFPAERALGAPDGGWPFEIKASVNIMQGCNNYCAYCVVPFVRGPEVSRPSSEILAEVKDLTARGVKEVLLLGQNVNSYGLKREGEISFARLLERLQEISGLERIRFTTSHPKDLSLELIDCFGRLSSLCEHIHLPVQAGSNRVLKRMNRHYTREMYLEKIGLLRDRCSDLAITSDIIVGFPGETEKDFQETLDLVQAVRYDDIFSFKYSNRSQTAASAFPDQVDEEEKSRRLKELQGRQKKITLGKQQTLIGTLQQIIVEGTSKKSSREWSGRTRTNKIVNFPGPTGLLGKTVPVRIEMAGTHSLKGRLIEG
jgi:tRNA-2-methylthio-N6-dimethylallyladenosine synthase